MYTILVHVAWRWILKHNWTCRHWLFGRLFVLTSCCSALAEGAQAEPAPWTDRGCTYHVWDAWAVMEL